MYLILHAFSRRNSGDGLLVDLTMEALEAAGVSRQNCALLALDPDSFPEIEAAYRAPGEPAARMSPRLAMAGVELACDLLSAGRLGSVAKLAAKADGMIAVGGGIWWQTALCGNWVCCSITWFRCLQPSAPMCQQYTCHKASVR